jgi:hypothetical protein
LAAPVIEATADAVSVVMPPLLDTTTTAERFAVGVTLSFLFDEL